MEQVILTSLAFALLLVVLPLVEGEICDTSLSMIEVVSPSNFQDPSKFGFALDGVTKGGAPTSFTWRKDNVVLNSSNPFNITDPMLTNSEDPCSERLYHSRLTVTGKVTGVFTYTANNAETSNTMVATLNVEDACKPSNLVVRQNGRFSTEISWTPSVPPPSGGYEITTVENIRSGILVKNPPYTYTTPDIGVGSVINIYLVSRSSHFYSGVLGPVSVTILGLLDPIVTTSSVTATSATIALAQPMNSHPADQYTVTLTRKSGQQPDCQSYVDNVNMTTSSDSVLLEGLEENSVYSVSVIAFTFNLTRSVSAANITTLTAAPSDSPSNLTYKTITSTSITLTWRNINCTQHNGVITHFGVQYHWKLDGVLVMMNIENSNTTNYTIDGLLPFTEYRFRIAGVNSEGPGPYTAFIGPIRTNEDVPGPVSGLTGYAAFYSIRLFWSSPQMPNGVLTRYNIMYTLTGSHSPNTASVIATSSQPTYTISNLEIMTTISKIIITAHTQIGPGLSAMFFNVFTTLSEPPVVNNVEVRVLTNSSVSVLWDILLITEITQYMIIYSQTGNRTIETAESALLVDSTESSVNITNLISGTEYQFQVVAQAVVEGEIIIGPRSLVTNMSVVNIMNATLPRSTKSISLVAITAVVVFFSTVVLYSIILSLVVIVAFYYRRKPNRKVTEVKECQAYVQVSESDHMSQGVLPAAMESIDMSSVNVYSSDI